MGRVGRRARQGRAGRTAARRPSWWPAALIAVAGVLAYANSFDGVFVYDDEPAIVDNTSIHGLWPLARFLRSAPDITVAGRPVAAFSFALNYATSGSAVFGYHLVNLTVHVLAALTLFGILRRTLPRTPLARDDDRLAGQLALAAALIWVVDPLNTAAVSYIVQRVESLMGLLYLLTLYTAIRAGEVGDRSSLGWSAGAVVACALGMATKEAMVTAPIAVVLWEFVFDRDRMWARRWRLYAALAATWAILAALVAANPRPHSAGFGNAVWPWHVYLRTQAAVIAHYLRLAIGPYPLVFDYGWLPARSWIEVAPQALIVAGLFAASVRAVARRRPIGFAGAWFFLALAPTSSIYPIVTEAAAEQRMYLPLAAVITLAVIGAHRTFVRLKPRAPSWEPIAAAAIVATFILMTAARNQAYASAEQLWGDTIAKRPANARAQTNFATSLLRSGRYAEAEQHLRVAVREQPDLAEAQADLGVALCGRGAFDEGIEHLQRAIAIEPGYGAAHHDLAEAYASKGDLATAAAHYGAALDLDPDNVVLLNRTAWILATAADDRARGGARAVQLAERAVRLTRHQDATSLDTLAAAQAEMGLFDDAARTGAAALAQARAHGEAALVPELEQRLAAYRTGRKVRE